MTTRTRLTVGIIVIVLAAIMVSALTLGSRPATVTAQDLRAADLYELLNRLSSENKSMTFQFDRPFLSGETLLTLPDSTTAGRALAEIGLDYVCFSEPWNDTRRVQCTPYSNIIGVSYEQ
jgi:Tat protein secretion system quality control protein TatD with DNase activity